MMVDAVQFITGFERTGSSLIVAIVLGAAFIFFIVFAPAIAFEWLSGRNAKNKDVESKDHSRSGDFECPEFGSKNCELRGCYIIGSCQYPR